MKQVKALLLSPRAEALMEFMPALPADIVVVPCVTPEATLTAIPGAEAVAGDESDFPDEFLARASKLRWIHVLNIGIEKFLAAHSVPADIVLTNSRGVTAATQAEHALTFMLALSRDLVHWSELKRQKRWDRGQYDRMTVLSGRTLGMLGFGAIGHEVARRARALGMRVVATRRSSAGERSIRDPDADEFLPMDRMLAVSDVVVIAVPLTRETSGMVDAAALRQMKPTAYLINLARGAIVDESALVEVLTSGRLAGAGLDVFEQEPLPTDSPLWALPNVIITPHVSGGSTKAIRRFVEFWADNLRRFASGEPLLNTVNRTLGY